MYVAVDGQDVGWHCLLTGAAEPPTDAALAMIFRGAVRGWLDEQAPRPTRIELSRATRESEKPRVGFDLALNPPAAAVLAKADELAAPRLAVEAQLRRRADEAVALLRQAAVITEAEFRRLHPVRAFWRRLFGLERPVEPQLAAEWRRVMAEVPPMGAEEWAYRVGAEGEQATALMLRGVPGWHALHAVPVGSRNADIDHVVIGPGGVFTLNSKHHQGASVWVGGDAFRVNRTWTRYVEKARHEAARATDLLEAAAGCGSRSPR